MAPKPKPKGKLPWHKAIAKKFGFKARRGDPGRSISPASVVPPIVVSPPGGEIGLSPSTSRQHHRSPLNDDVSPGIAKLETNAHHGLLGVDTTGLPSTVKESLAACPQFRILVVGNTGIGKSSLISSIFNIDLKDIDISHNRAGRANIGYGYTSSENPRFILHDSQGFEPGSAGNWDIAEKFLRERSAKSKLEDRLHAIWLCIETPRTGSRLQQTGDEKLLSLASELNVSVVVVFTKYDILVNEHIKSAQKHGTSQPDIRSAAEKNAAVYFENRIKDFRLSAGVSCVKVSTRSKYPQHLKTLQALATITRKILHHVEGDLWIPWAAAQQISAQQKVNFSIREGFKKYWIDLGTSTVFQGQDLIDCVRRIHDDILDVWNFNDPQKMLSGDRFRTSMVQLVSPLLSETDIQTDQHNWLSQYSDLMSLATAVGTTFAQVLGGTGITVFAFKYLYGRYQQIPMTSRYLGAYIVDLTLVLHDLFIDTLTKEPPRQVSAELVFDAFAKYKDSHSEENHGRIRALISESSPLHVEDKVADLIRKLLQIQIDGE